MPGHVCCNVQHYSSLCDGERPSLSCIAGFTQRERAALAVLTMANLTLHSIYVGRSYVSRNSLQMQTE